jgi:hypothetical protein
MSDKKETAQEVPVQEQLDDLYPMKVELINSISSGVAKSRFENVLLDSTEAIKITIEINSNLYLKKDLQEGISQACQKVLGYFY